MARKSRRRITYVLPLENSHGGHRLGVNGLAIDSYNSRLYSGGRDGVVCVWDIGQESADKLGRSASIAPDLNTAQPEGSPLAPKSKHINQIQAHTHWVNDIFLVQSNSTVVSASSDLTVKAWRPLSEDPDHVPQTIGIHADYVKRLASPSIHSDWVASGGLDHQICLWDLNKATSKLKIHVKDDSSDMEKGSIYALSARGNMMASGGPEGIVRLWDPRTGCRIRNFLGHTGNVRDILINEYGDTVMTASSDQSIKIWSIRAGRCMYTLSMHNDSVWSLFSDHPQLSVFYSSDRSGLIAKTDIRYCDDFDEGLSLAVAQEQHGVNKIVASDDSIWSAASTAEITRWRDIDTTLAAKDIQMQRRDQKPNESIETCNGVPRPLSRQSGKWLITKSSLLQVTDSSDTFNIITRIDGISSEETTVADDYLDQPSPMQRHALETFTGENGLIKHLLLSDRKRALTMDTAGNIVLWDLIKCQVIGRYGPRDIDEVRLEIDTVENVSNWCTLNTRTGQLAVALEENYCFDAEVYLDQVKLDEPTTYRDDQRVNLGKWILKYLFQSLIESEILRDTKYRESLLSNTVECSQAGGDSGTQMSPSLHSTGKVTAIPPQQSHAISSPTSPIAPISPSTPAQLTPTTIFDNSIPLPRSSLQSQRKSSSERSSTCLSDTGHRPTDATSRIPASDTQPGTHSGVNPPFEGGDRAEKSGATLFGKKFRMNFPRKLGGGRSSSEDRPPVLDEQFDESERLDEVETAVPDSLFGSIQKLRLDYNEQQRRSPGKLVPSSLQPLSTDDSPLLRLPLATLIIIQEDKPELGGVVDLYRGTIDDLGRNADAVEEYAPMWLGDLLFKNELPYKELVKLPFVLLPYEDLLPAIAGADGNTRLTAIRVLRAKKIIAYVSDRIETIAALGIEPDPGGMKPEEYLDLYCQGQLVNHNTTLATLRACTWKAGGDVVLHYRSNGKKAALEDAIARRKATQASGKTGPTLPKT